MTTETPNIIDQIRRFNILAGNTVDTYNVRQSALYTGLMLEELAEKLNRLGFISTAGNLDSLGRDFKRGNYDDLFYQVSREHLLDDDVDLVVVTLGSMMSMGVDVQGAFNEVHRANMSKVFPDGTMHKDSNGKIIKPETFVGPNLAPFVHNGKGC